jgi:hypothetical protein
MTYILYREIATCVDAMHNCIKNQEQSPHLVEWVGRHRERAEWMAKEYLPSGSGIDSGTTVDVAASTSDKLVLNTAFHHMNERGYYDGWTEHTVTVRPSLMHEITLSISGRDRNDIKDYLHEIFHQALTAEIPADRRAPTDRDAIFERLP